MTSFTDSAFSLSTFFSLSFSLFSSDCVVFSTLGDLDLDLAFVFGDLSGVLDLDFDLRLMFDSPSSSELDDEELDDEELDDDPGGAEYIWNTVFFLN